MLLHIKRKSVSSCLSFAQQNICAAELSSTTMNAELVSFLLLHDNLEVVIMTLTKAKEAAAKAAEGWGTSQEN